MLFTNFFLFVSHSKRNANHAKWKHAKYILIPNELFAVAKVYITIVHTLFIIGCHGIYHLKWQRITHIIRNDTLFGCDPFLCSPHFYSARALTMVYNNNFIFFNFSFLFQFFLLLFFVDRAGEFDQLRQHIDFIPDYIAFNVFVNFHCKSQFKS